MIARNLRRSLALSTALALGMAASPALAQLVSSGDLVSANDSNGNPGQLSINNPDASTANISVLAPVVVAEWTNFNVPEGTTANITNGSSAASAALLNRVIGGSPSDLGGTINANNVNLWILNQNGILFGSNTAINANSFVASTLDIANQDFFDAFEGTDVFGNGTDTVNFAGPSTAGLIAPGGATIMTTGDLVLVSQDISFNATFDAGMGRVGLVAASNVDVGFTAGSPLSFSLNAGTAIANQTIGGRVTGAEISFVMLSQAGVMNALLDINADVTANTAAPTNRGILLTAASANALDGASINTTGKLSSTGAVSLNAETNFTASDAITGASITALAGAAFDAQSITASAGDIDIEAGSVNAGVLSASADLSVDASGAVSLASALADSDGSGAGSLAIGATTLPSGVSVTGASQGVSVDIQSSGGVQLNAVSSTGGAVSLDSTGGTLSTGAVSATGGDAQLAAAGDVSAASVASATGAVGVASTGGGALDLGNLAAATTTSLQTSGTLRLGNLTTGTTATIGTDRSPSSVIATGVVTTPALIANTTGGLTFDGANAIESLDAITASGPIAINTTTDLSVNGLVTAPGQDVTLTSGGDLSIAAAGSVSGRIVGLSASGNFVNDRGADVVTASDHWVVYSNAPAGNNFNNLDSGNTAIWNQTINSLAPGAVNGNRYVFAFQPTVTVTTTDASKVYGTDLSGQLGSNFTTTGFQPGVAGAFLADTAANVLSGAPQITSTGTPERADVADSPYVITVSAGSLTAARGYAIAYDNAGRLKVTARSITASVTANDKTYDGTTAGTGSVTLNGVVAGDTVGTTGTSFAFADKNAGVDKTVALSGTTLTGTDAGNYTLSVPGSALADILRRTIAIAADNQTKAEGATDPALTFTITAGSLVAGDGPSGGLSREGGESPALYDILIGSLTAGQNYTIEFSPGILTIVPSDTTPDTDIDSVPIVLRSIPLPGDSGALGTENGSFTLTVDESAFCEDGADECDAQ